jgi:hypothetical protein
VQGTAENVRANPHLFFSRPGATLYLAHGKDPYFPPWTDTVQINYASREAREALIEELLRIAKLADGVRCDMAMLVLNQVFQKNWGPFIQKDAFPKEEFWATAIPKVKKQNQKFLFLAEVYWGL